MREITTHKVNGLNEAIEIKVLDEPGPGGANHRYRVCIPMLDPAEHHVAENSRRSLSYCNINFQNGPILESGYNGISNEALLAVVEDRLKGFQEGKFACPENFEALKYVRLALEALKSRTLKRMERGVEGTNVV